MSFSDKTLVYTHSDVDGIMSARVAQWTERYFQGDVSFTPEVYFGIKGLESHDWSNYNELLCLDIGSAEETLRYLSSHAEDHRIFLFDHHPTSPSLFPKYTSKNFRISWDPEHCTCSLMYSVFQSLGMFTDTYWPEKWTIIGIYGDAAKEKPKAREVLLKLAEKHPDLTNLSEVSSSSGSKSWMYQPASMIARGINMVRRIGYQHGAMVVLKALKEAEGADDVFLLVRDLTLKEQVKYPYISLMRSYVRAYREAQRNLQYRLLDFGLLGMVIVSSRADIGGAIAWRAMKRVGKPVFIVNDGILDGVYRITGRSQTSLDLNLVLERAKVLSGGVLSGGGHPQAVSGLVPAELGLSRLAKILLSAAQEVVKDCQKNQD